MSQTNLKDRPFKRAMFGRRLRKIALHKHRGHQFTAAEYDQFCAKTQNLKALQSICDMLETGVWGEPVWDIEWWAWLNNNWKPIRVFVDDLDSVPLVPEVSHDTAPKRRGRRSRLLSYTDDPEFVADKEATLRELDPPEAPDTFPFSQ